LYLYILDTLLKSLNCHFIIQKMCVLHTKSIVLFIYLNDAFKTFRTQPSAVLFSPQEQWITFDARIIVIQFIWRQNS
jgi:hypothetical protein